MPPKAKFTREEIIEAAFEIVKADGLAALTARALGEKLGSSARPIFTIFNSMEEVQQEVIQLIRQVYKKYVDDGLNQTQMPAFKGVGTQYINFAIKEPKLFQILFMSECSKKPDVENVLPVIDENYPKILNSVQTLYSLDVPESEWLYRHLWIYTHGIAVLSATGMCLFSGEEIGKMLSEICIALLKELKADKV